MILAVPLVSDFALVVGLEEGVYFIWYLKERSENTGRDKVPHTNYVWGSFIL